MFGPISKGASPIFSSDGTLLTDKKEITKRWAEHFSNVLNRESTVDQEVIDNLPQKSTIENLADSPSISEVEKAIKQLSNEEGVEVDTMSDVYEAENSKSLAERVAEAISVFSDDSLAPTKKRRTTGVPLLMESSDEKPMELKIMSLDN
ncbi:Hypothetical predicted protein [Octopus vulgaris]|uniref:Uncharacterized protein n=1 Tax=Octopus vulgaris TaxID=6645 RepID=A0AA36B183_OCTVU|nr:Hypothetical predicted protein [Octopus vulgaris]